VDVARGILATEIAAIAVWIEEADGAGVSRLDRSAAWITADAKAAEGGAVIAAVLGEDFGPARNHSGHDKRLVCRLAARVDEEALVEIAGRPLRQSIGESDPFGGQYLGRDAAGFLRLLLDRFNHAAVAVAQVAVKKLRQEIEVTPPLAIVEVNALAALKLQNWVFALLDGPGQKEMAAWRCERGHAWFLAEKRQRD